MKNEKNNIFSIFFRKIWQNDEKSEKWWKWLRYSWKRSKLMKNGKKIFFGFFEKRMGKSRKKWKLMKMGQILMKTVKINEKWKNAYFWFFQNNMKKCRTKWKMKMGQWKMKKIIIFGFFRIVWKNVEQSEKWWKWVRYW